MGKINLPRFLLAGSNSGSGKTIITCGLLKALLNKGLSVSSFKCGPDYLDPMFHKRITKKAATNLDLFLTNPATMIYLTAENAHKTDIAVIEGVMGLYDGWGLDSDQYSTNDVALTLKSPEILILNGKGRSFSLLAELYGYLNFKENLIKGVIINQINEASYKKFKEIIEKTFAIKVLGYLDNDKNLAIESRHLGLVMDWEVDAFDEKIEALAARLEKTIDLKALLAIAKSAPTLEFDEAIGQFNFQANLKIGIANDRAFCFHYNDNFKLLEKLGAELIFFSPLKDAFLPKVNGLILSGGYPELFAQELIANKTMITDLQNKLKQGLPVLAEGGGLIYLSQNIHGKDGIVHEMLGALPVYAKHETKLKNFGYVELSALKDNLLCKKGAKIRAHEFHYCQHNIPGDVFLAEKKNKVQWGTGFSTNSIYAGYPHFHFWGCPEFLINFLNNCQSRLNK